MEKIGQYERKRKMTKAKNTSWYEKMGNGPGMDEKKDWYFLWRRTKSDTVKPSTKESCPASAIVIHSLIFIFQNCYVQLRVIETDW